MKDFWKRKLTPWDAELMLMVERLTEKPCEPRNGGDDYFFEADYELHNDPQYILAMWDAIEGRAGKRLVNIQDDAERHCLLVHIAFSEENLPGIVRLKGSGTPNPKNGNLYIDAYGGLVVAVRVTRNNYQRLTDFIGNGEMELPKDGPCCFHFINAESVFADAPEGSYIIYRGHSRFEVMAADGFQHNYFLFE